MSAVSNELKLTTPSDLQIVMAREFKGPRDLVFEAHSSCDHMARWWGPRRYEISECDIDFRPGGAWRIVHRGSQGEEFGSRGEFRDIVPPSRIVWTFEFEGASGSISIQALVLTEHGPTTTLTATVEFDTVQERDGMLESGMEGGAGETYERLDEYLEVLRARSL